MHYPHVTELIKKVCQENHIQMAVERNTMLRCCGIIGLILGIPINIWIAFYRVQSIIPVGQPLLYHEQIYRFSLKNNSN